MRLDPVGVATSEVIIFADEVVFRVGVVTAQPPSVRCDRSLGHFVENPLAVDLDGCLALKANDSQLERAGLSSLPRCGSHRGAHPRYGLVERGRTVIPKGDVVGEVSLARGRVLRGPGAREFGPLGPGWLAGDRVRQIGPRIRIIENRPIRGTTDQVDGNRAQSVFGQVALYRGTDLLYPGIVRLPGVSARMERQRAVAVHVTYEGEPLIRAFDLNLHRLDGVREYGAVTVHAHIPQISVDGNGTGEFLTRVGPVTIRRRGNRKESSAAKETNEDSLVPPQW